MLPKWIYYRNLQNFTFVFVNVVWSIVNLRVVRLGILLNHGTRIDRLHYFFKELHHFTIVLCAALNVTALPVFRHETGNVFSLLSVDFIPRFWVDGSFCGRFVLRHSVNFLYEVLLVTNDHQRYVAHVSALYYLFSESANILKGVYVGEVKDEDVRRGTSQTVEPVVRPFVVGVHRKIRYNRYVGDLEFVQTLIDDDGWVVGVFSIRRNISVVKFVPNELLKRKKGKFKFESVAALGRIERPLPEIG